MSPLRRRFFERLSVPVAKVCGLTRQADLDHAIGCGADLVGLVSYEPSPRHLSDMLIVGLASTIRGSGARSVLVTVDAERGAVDRLAHEAGLDAVQLCGAEEPEDWRHASFGLLRRVGVDSSGLDEIERWSGIADGFVLDHPASVGGSGAPVSLELAVRLAGEAPCLLAGGLDGDADVFGTAARPFAGAFAGFDASSRLESSPGIKDAARVTTFVQSIHRLRAASAATHHDAD